MAAGLPAALTAYRLATAMLAPAAPFLLAERARRGKEDPVRIAERYGIASIDRPAGDLVWAHGASIGESLALLPLVEMIVRRGIPVLVTSGTVTSAEILARRLPPGARHQYIPLDVPRFVGRFLDYWQPHLALFAESELWPTCVTELDRRQVALVLVNARMSQRSFAGWSRAPRTANALTSRLALCVAQARADGERFALLGAPVCVVAGNLKFDASPPPADPAVVERVLTSFAGRPVWLAASTHPGEDEMVLAAHKLARERFPTLLTLVAPRHPTRGRAVAGLAGAGGLKVIRRSGRDRLLADTDIYVVDTVGELGLFFRVVPIVLMGGSLIPHGGQNPIEPARLGSALLHGPDIHNFADVYEALDREGGALSVATGEELGATLSDLLADPALTRDMARAGLAAIGSFSGALERTMKAIAAYLPPPRDAADARW